MTLLDLNTIDLNKIDEPLEIDVVFVVSIVDDYSGNILHKKGWDAELLINSPCIDDVGLIIPDEINEGVYECKNLRVIHHQDLGNPDDSEISYDLECDWKPIWTLDSYKQNN